MKTVLLVDDQSFEVNGVRYAPKQERRSNSGRQFSKLMTMASMMYAPYMDMLYGNQYQRKLPEGTDIVKEFGLIQKKESKLSKWERDMVVRIFQNNYYKVEQNKQ